MRKIPLFLFIIIYYIYIIYNNKILLQLFFSGTHSLNVTLLQSYNVTFHVLTILPVFSILTLVSCSPDSLRNIVLASYLVPDT